MKLNLGCSDRLLAGYVNVDLHKPADKIADLNERWPWEDSTIDEVRAWDLVEHLRSPIHTMNEAWRILKPGGRFDIVVPTTDGRGWAQDPTHVCWPPFNRNSFFYYEHGNPHLTRFAPMNGVKCAYRILHSDEKLLVDQVIKLHIILEAVK
jgi:predicted SAM-dependent methyltransferase